MDEDNQGQYFSGNTIRRNRGRKCPGVVNPDEAVRKPEHYVRAL